MSEHARDATPFRVNPPADDALVDWPSDFGTRFFITVDTEEEFDWSAPFSRDARAVSAIAAMPAAAARFRDQGAALTALIDHPVATDATAIEHMRRAEFDSAVAIGAQLHPWVTPPHDEIVSARNSFAGNLPPDLEDRKIANLTAAVAENFPQPRIFRAGRYGLGPHTLGALARQGYRIDSSMRARYDYSAEGGADFRGIGNAAFRVGDITEIPLTTVFTGVLRGQGASLSPAAARLPFATGALARSGLLSRVSLTPERMPLRDALAAIRVILDEGPRLLLLSFHSPSLVPGHTPYVRDAADLAEFWRWWDGVLNLFARRGIASASLNDLLAALA